MKPGENFELECVEYLEKKYKSMNVKFKHHNTADSTQSDIEVIIDKETVFFIEAKNAAAQSGQFVLFADDKNKKFIFSKKNKSENNLMTDIIIDYMNKNFSRYSNAGTAGEKIEIDQDVFEKWIIDYYKKKNVKYIISKYKSDIVIFPIEKFSSYFIINATYRIKKSGSRNPAKKNFENIVSELKAKYEIEGYFSEGKKLFIKSEDSLSKTYFNINENEFYLSPVKLEDILEVKQLSNTKNRNVIFSIKLIKKQDFSDLDLFENEFIR